MKKQIAIIALLATAVSSCTTANNQPTPMENRNPSSLSDSIQTSANTVSQVTMNSFQWSADGVHSVAVGISDLAKAGANLSVKAVGVSRDVATIVFDTTSNVLEGSKDSASTAARFVVTSAGQVIHSSINGSRSSLNASKSAVQASVTVASEAFGTSKTISIQVWNVSHTALIGSLEVSGKLADSTSNAIKNGSQFIVDAAGVLWTSSGQVVGQVWDSSKHAVSFVVDSTGKIFEGALNGSVVVFTSTSDNSVSFAKHVWDGLRSAGHVSAEVVRASAQGSVMIVKASGQSLMAVSDAIGGIFQEKY